MLIMSAILGGRTRRALTWSMGDIGKQTRLESGSHSDGSHSSSGKFWCSISPASALQVQVDLWRGGV